MNKINFIRPNKENLQLYLLIGSLFIILSILDVFLKSYFTINLASFLPDTLNFFLPLILGAVGFYFVRIEFTGIKNLDSIVTGDLCLEALDFSLKNIQYINAITPLKLVDEIKIRQSNLLEILNEFN